jgi:thiosulfate/3-mercaptopyruvate sulfurtransferase
MFNKRARVLILKFSDTTNPLPSNTLPDADAFCKKAKLGINKDSKIVVYDSLGIYESASLVVIHHYGT